MFTEIGIENFKSFGKMQRILLKPITLLYGPNSSGKSSLMQALLLFKQTLDEGRSKQGALIPRGQLLDAGTYREFINCHDEQKEFGFSIAMDAHELADDNWYIWSPAQIIALDMRFALDKQRNIRVKAIDISDRVGGEVVTAYRLLDDIPEMQSKIAMYERLLQEFIEKNDPEAIKNTNYKKAKEELEKLKTSNMLCRTELNLDHPCVKARWDNNADIKRKEQEEGEEPFDMGLAEEMTRLKERLAKARAKEAKVEEETFENIQAKEEIKKCERYLSFLESLHKSTQDLSDSAYFLMQLGATVSNYEAVDRLLVLGNCFPQKLVTGEEYRFIHEVSQAGALTEQQASDSRENDEAHCFYLPYTAVLLASRCFQDMLAATTYIGPLRAMPERMYAYSGTAPATVGSKGENTTDILIARPDILEKVNAWLKHLEAGYEIDVRPVVRDYYEIVLINTVTGAESCIKDVGFGISQILPILVDGLVSDRYEWNGQYYDRFEWRCKFIEQPEIHIHPRLQTDLADFFIEGAKKKQCQYIIETHSEHLLLRLLRRIRETTNGELEEGLPPLKPEDVAVIYAKPTEHGTELMELRISEDGDFIDKWPEGFFTEREKELF